MTHDLRILSRVTIIIHEKEWEIIKNTFNIQDKELTSLSFAFRRTTLCLPPSPDPESLEVI